MGRFIDLVGGVCLAVCLAVLGIGLPVVNDSLPAERPVSAGTPYAVADGVTVVPPRDAVLDVTGTRPADREGTVLFRVGPVRCLISVRPFDGDLDAAADGLRGRITGNGGYQVTGAQLAVATSTGLAGVQGGYTGPGRGGRYAVFVTAGRLVEITVTGDDLDLGRFLPAVDDSIRTLKVEAVS